MFKNVILASNSPRRHQLLKEVIGDFQIRAKSINERISYVNPRELVEMLSRQKAEAVAVDFRDSLIIGADTIVVFNGRVLNKPVDNNEAYEMLHQLSGRNHFVFTGVTLLYNKNSLTFVAQTEVAFHNLSDEQIADYVKTGSCLDKAGAYGVQDSDFVKEIFGSKSNVMGLPVEELRLKLEIFDKECNG